jgi:hypothetical protein
MLRMLDAQNVFCIGPFSSMPNRLMIHLERYQGVSSSTSLVRSGAFLSLFFILFSKNLISMISHFYVLSFKFSILNF